MYEDFPKKEEKSDVFRIRISKEVQGKIDEFKKENDFEEMNLTDFLHFCMEMTFRVVAGDKKLRDSDFVKKSIKLQETIRKELEASQILRKYAIDFAELNQEIPKFDQEVTDSLEFESKTFRERRKPGRPKIKRRRGKPSKN